MEITLLLTSAFLFLLIMALKLGIKYTLYKTRQLEAEAEMLDLQLLEKQTTLTTLKLYNLELKDSQLN